MTIFGQPFNSFFIPPRLRPGAGEVDLSTAIISSVEYYTKILAGVAAFVSFAYIVYAGYIMFTAFGDEAKYAQGKKTLQYAIIGFIISMLSYFLIHFFVRLLGYTDV